MEIAATSVKLDKLRNRFILVNPCLLFVCVPVYPNMDTTSKIGTADNTSVVRRIWYLSIECSSLSANSLLLLYVTIFGGGAGH